MAASITGVFTIVDRASAPMRRMEAQAIATMTAIEGVGKAQDRQSGGADKAGREMEKTTRIMKDADRAASDLDRSMQKSARSHDNAGRSARNSGSSFDRMATSLGKVNQVFKFFGSLISAAKLPALGVAISVAAQAVGTLAGGFVSLLPGLAQSMGIFAALPQTIMAGVQGLAVFRLATMGVSQAIQQGIQIQQNYSFVMAQVADQHVQAVHAVTEAEFNLGQTQQNVTQAQIALTQARRDAIRNLTDLRLAALGADLSQKRAALSLRESQQQLAMAAINPQTTDLQMQDLSLGVAEAQLQVSQATVNRTRSHVDLHRAQQRGVGGNLQVIAAERGLQQAVHASTDAIYQLTEAQKALALQMSGNTGPLAAFNQAMKNLTPSARGFVLHVIALNKEFRGLREAAGGGLFPGLDRALSHIVSMLPMVERVARRTGDAIGGVISRATARFATAGRQQDLGALGSDNANILRRMGDGATNLASAMVDFMRAAQPFTDWLTKTLYQGTQWIEQWAAQRRASGAFADMLDRVKARLQQFWQIAKDGWAIVRDIFKAATPLGDRLWAGFAQGVHNVRVAADTDMPKIQAWFDALYPGLHAMGQLLKSIAGAWARITPQPSFARTVTTLNTAVPSLERLFRAGGNLGPTVAHTLGTILRLLNDIPFGGLQMLLGLLDKILGVLDFLLRKIPGLKYALAGLLMLTAMRKAISMVGELFLKWLALFGLWEKGPKGGPGGPMGGPGGPMGGGPMPMGGGGGGALRGFAQNYAYMRGGAGEPGLGRFAAARAAAAERGGGSALRGLGAMGMEGAAGMASMMAPFLGISAALGMATTQGNFGERVLGGVRGLGFGTLDNVAITGAEHKQAAGKWVQKRLGNLMGGADPGSLNYTQLGIRIGALERLTGRTSHEATKSGLFQGVAIAGINRGEHNERMKELNAELKVEREMLKTLRDRADTDKANRFGTNLGGIFDVYSKKLGGTKAATHQTVSDIIQQFTTMHGAGRQVLAQQALDWTKQMAQTHKGMGGEMAGARDQIVASLRDMGDKVAVINGQILVGSTNIWKQVSTALSDPVEVAKERVTKGFTDMQTKALRALEDMGYTPGEATGILRGTAAANIAQAGGTAQQVASAARGGGAHGHSGAVSYSSSGAKHAKGGRIAGQGTQDTVPLTLGMAAPGELIVNRHTERRLNDLLGLFGTSVGGEVQRETRPHYFTMGGYLAEAKRDARKYGLDPTIFARQINQESGFNPGATSGAGALGIAQIMPATAAAWGVNPLDPHAALNAAAKNMAEYVHTYGSYRNALIAYNAGPGAIGHALPAETINYIATILHGANPDPSGAMGGGAAHIHSPRFPMPGVAGSLARTAMHAMAAGLNRRLDMSAGTATPTGGPADATPTGVKGLATFKGVTMAKWIADELSWASRHGWNGQPTSGYRPGVDPHTASATSEHQGTQYPHGAVDFGGFTDPAAYATKMALLAVAKDYPGPKLIAPIGFHDDGHLSGTGHALGGRLDWGGWHARGGQFNVTRPTIFGAGEAGPETVTISRGGGSRAIQVHIAHIDYRHSGDLRKAIEDELGALADDLNLVGHEPD